MKIRRRERILRAFKKEKGDRREKEVIRGSKTN